MYNTPSEYKAITAEEKYVYQQILNRLDKAYPGREVLTAPELSQFTGLSAPTVRARFPRNDWGKYSKCVIAQYLAWHTYKHGD